MMARRELDLSEAAPRSLAGKTAWSALSVLALTAGRFAANIIAARTLGPALSGQVVYLLWIADSVSLVASLGLHSTVLRFTAELNSQGRREEAGALLKWSLLRFGAMQCLASVLLAAALPTLTGSPLPAALRVFLLAYSLTQAAMMFVTAYLAGRQRFDVSARLNAVSGLALTVAVAIGCRFAGAAGAVIGYAAGALPALFFGWRMLSGHASTSIRLAPELRRRALKYGAFTCFAAVVSAFVWSRSEIYFLSRYCGFHAVAMFNVGLSLCTMANQAAALLTSGLVPHFAELAGSANFAAMQRTYTSLTRLVALVVFPLSLAFAASAPSLVPLLYGRAFLDAVPAATALAVLASLSAANVGSALVYGREKSWFVAASGTGGALLAIAGGLVIVPAWGALGAAASRAVVQCCMIGVGTWYIRTRLACPFPWMALLKTMAAAAVAAAAGRAIIEVRADLPGFVLACAVIALVYGALVRALGLFHADDALIVHRMLAKLPAGLARPVGRATDWLAGLAYQPAYHGTPGAADRSEAMSL